MKVPVAISARHAHLTRETIDTLFGCGHELQIEKDLSQPHEFAARERITIVGPRGRLEDVRIVGPLRLADQIELSRSDALHLGIEPVLRTSGDLHQTPGILLKGPEGCVELSHGAILARRHLHLNSVDAQRLELHNGDFVAVAIDSAGRDLVFDDVIVRISPDFRTELHLDTDEGNAAAADTGTVATVLPERTRQA